MSGIIRTACVYLAGLGLGTLLMGAVPARGQGTFIGIGHVPGDPESKGLAISADGSVVVGSTYYSGSAEHAYRWTAATGIRLINTPGFELSTTAYAVSGDGLLMGGNTNNLIDSPAWSWTEAGGAVTLFNRGTIRAASTTGAVLAGYTMEGGTHSLHAVRWTEADGVRSLEPNGQTISHSEALGLTADGALAVGQAIFPTFNSLRAFLWSAATGMQNIGSTDPAGHPSRAWAITRDGAVVVGGAQFLGMPLDAFRWTSAGGMQDLGSLSGIDDTDALAVSDNGNTVVGTCGKTLAGTLSGQAFVWHPAIGLRNLQTFLGALVPSGWTLIEARGVSSDGTVIIGWGRNPVNQIEGWVVRLPGGVVPVRLLSFTVERHGSEAVIQWQVGDAIDHAGFHVYRQETDGDRVKLTTTLLTGQQEYRFVDATPPSTELKYWLAELSRAGTVSWYGPAALLAAGPQVATRPVQASPNPTGAEVSIRFSTSTARQVVIEVFDLSGRLVRSAPKAAYDSGEHAWQWDGRDQTGAPVRAGLYFFVVRTGESTQSGKIAIVR